MMALAGIDMLPPEIGVPVVRREITAAVTAAKCVVAGGLGLLAAERDGFDPVAARSSLDATSGPMLGVFTGWTSADGLTMRHRPRSGRTELPRPSPHRRHTGTAGRDGHRGLRRSGVGFGHRLDDRRGRRRRLPGAVQVLPGRAPHPRVRRTTLPRRRRTACRLPPGRPTVAGQPARADHHSFQRTRAAVAYLGSTPRLRSSGRAERSGRRRRRRLPHLLPRARLSGASTPPGATATVWSGAWQRTFHRITGPTMHHCSSSHG